MRTSKKLPPRYARRNHQLENCRMSSALASTLLSTPMHASHACALPNTAIVPDVTLTDDAFAIRVSSARSIIDNIYLRTIYGSMFSE